MTDQEEALRAGIYENPDTPGYHAALVGGGPIGSVLSMCQKCAALVPNTGNARQVHDHWHEQIKGLAQGLMEHRHETVKAAPDDE